MDEQPKFTPEEQDALDHPGYSLTDEQISEIGAARHAFSYPGIVGVRRRVREGYVSNGGVHYAGAELDADKLLEIVDQLYAEGERLKAALKPFAEMWHQYEAWCDNHLHSNSDPYHILDFLDPNYGHYKGEVVDPFAKAGEALPVDQS